MLGTWLSGLLGGPAPQPRGLLGDPTMTNPVGWSSVYPPQYMSNPDPNVSPVVSRGSMTDLAALGTLGRKGYVTAAELPAAEAKAKQALDYGMIAASASSPLGIRAFHGSPHTFDRFDLSKIGTGEGAQAYGHGLYFAGNEGVARTYQAMNAPAYQGPGAVRLANEAAELAKTRGLTGEDAATFAKKWLNDQAPKVNAMPPQYYYDAANNFDIIMGRAPGRAGSMYEVSLRTSPERLLDWDAPLSAQPAKTAKALAKAGYPQSNIDALLSGRGPYGGMKLGDAQTGLPRFLQKPDASAALQKSGLDGIQYLDAGSRAAGDGTRNYVMFDDKLIDILRRYGLLGMLGGGGAAGLLAPEAPQQ